MAEKYRLKVRLIAEGNFYVEAESLEEAKEVVYCTEFLNRDLINKYLLLEYKKEFMSAEICHKETQQA